jgi:hypothetical protein
MRLILCSILTLSMTLVLSLQMPRWDLGRNGIPAELNHGAVWNAAGTVTVGGENYFGIPAWAFPDQKNFTVQVSVSFPQPAEDTGLGLTCIYGKPDFGKVYRPIIKGMHVEGVRMKFQAAVPLTFDVAVRNGSASDYLDDVLGTKHFTMLLPSDEAMWVGKRLLPREKPFASAEIKVDTVIQQGAAVADFKVIFFLARTATIPRARLTETRPGGNSYYLFEC